MADGGQLEGSVLTPIDNHLPSAIRHQHHLSLVIARRGLVPVRLDNSAGHQMLANDSPGAVHVDGVIPDIAWVNDDHRPVLALVHASGVIDSDSSLETRVLDTVLECAVNCFRTPAWAVRARRAHKDVVLVLSHAAKINCISLREVTLRGWEIVHRSRKNKRLDRMKRIDRMGAE